jgi:hypothetical protein
MTIGRGGMTIAERDEAGDADARVSGAERAWVEAFSPNGSRAGLKFEGDASVADGVLEVCGAAAAANSASSAVA